MCFCLSMFLAYVTFACSSCCFLFTIILLQLLLSVQSICVQSVFKSPSIFCFYSHTASDDLKGLAGMLCWIPLWELSGFDGLQRRPLSRSDILPLQALVGMVLYPAVSELWLLNLLRGEPYFMNSGCSEKENDFLFSFPFLKWIILYE